MVKQLLEWLGWRTKRIELAPPPISFGSPKGMKLEPLKKVLPKTPRKPRVCMVTSKKCRTEQQAKDNAVRNAANSLNGLRAYKCPFCDWWHLTHKKNKLKMH